MFDVKFVEEMIDVNRNRGRRRYQVLTNTKVEDSYVVLKRSAEAREL